MAKATNLKLTAAYLHKRAMRMEGMGYEIPKWIGFCRELLKLGFAVYLYEARRTVSKYITVTCADMRPFKVRFSNHRPIRHRELEGDCDFFVGVTNLGVTNTEMAMQAVLMHFEPDEGALADG